MFGEGTYRVGSDIEPGTYRAPGGEFCGWRRLSGFSGDFDDVIAISLPDGPTIVTILATDAGFESGGCGEWSPQPATGPESRSFTDGTFEVGVDIASGTYRAEGGEFCSWYRLSGFTGDSDDILAIALPDGQAIVTILDTDAGFETGGCGEWSPQPETGPQATTFGDGVFEVGVNIAPGTYRAPGGEFCSWYRLSGFTGDSDDILAIDLPEGQAIVTIVASDVGFEGGGCGQWEPQPATGPQVTSFSDGTYEVGVDIAPGTYQAPGGEFCSWYRLSGFSGDFDEVLAIELPEGQAIATILPSDRGFQTSDCGTWARLE